MKNITNTILGSLLMIACNKDPKPGLIAPPTPSSNIKIEKEEKFSDLVEQEKAKLNSLQDQIKQSEEKYVPPPDAHPKTIISDDDFNKIGKITYDKCFSTESKSKFKRSTVIYYCECKANILINQIKENALYQEDILNILTDDLAQKISELSAICLMVKLDGRDP